MRTAAEVRKQGRASAAPCALCHGARGPIDYRTQREADRDARAAGEWWLLGVHRPLALAVDHIVPHVAGGSDDITNAAQSHAICNAEAGAKRAPRTTKPKPVNGYWRPVNGRGEPLPGRALPGASTSTHVFVAEGWGPTPTPRPGLGSSGVADPSKLPEPPRRHKP